MASNEDYYKLLDVSREASSDEIRKAYRKLARKYHPDLNPGDKAAEEPTTHALSTVDATAFLLSLALSATQSPQDRTPMIVTAEHSCVAKADTSSASTTKSFFIESSHLMNATSASYEQ